MTDVDHTTVRLLETLNKRKRNDETRRDQCIPVIILMPVSVDEDIKNHVLATGGYDVILQQPVTSKEVFSTVLYLLHRRYVVEGAYRGLRKQHISTKYPHLQIFADERLTQKAPSEDELEDDEDEEESMEDNTLSTTIDVEVDESNQSTVDLHPVSINELRNVYSRSAKKRTYTLKSSMLGGSVRVMDAKAYQHIDKHIVKSLIAKSELEGVKDDSESEDEQPAARCVISGQLQFPNTCSSHRIP